jgi:hypothetical protein
VLDTKLVREVKGGRTSDQSCMTFLLSDSSMSISLSRIEFSVEKWLGLVTKKLCSFIEALPMIKSMGLFGSTKTFKESVVSFKLISFLYVKLTKTHLNC